MWKFWVKPSARIFYKEKEKDRKKKRMFFIAVAKTELENQCLIDIEIMS